MVPTMYKIHGKETGRKDDIQGLGVGIMDDFYFPRFTLLSLIYMVNPFCSKIRKDK